MRAPPQKHDSPVAAGLCAEQTKNESSNFATCAASWEYRVRQVLGRFLVVSPLGIVREDCAAKTSAQRLAAALNGRADLEALA